jgi:hypothetical protein
MLTNSTAILAELIAIPKWFGTFFLYVSFCPHLHQPFLHQLLRWDLTVLIIFSSSVFLGFAKVQGRSAGKRSVVSSMIIPVDRYFLDFLFILTFSTFLQFGAAEILIYR